ncbi:MAG TPA: phosphatidate cytidylyltransferase [Chitinophagaceae bacterium]|nr:phosphatidate cytidylyltransferase [Chitinophagaceae bacterium]
MAFNKETFRTRATTAVVFVCIMAAGLLWNRWSFFVLFSIVHFGCWQEYQKLVSLFNPDFKTISPVHRWGVQLGGWCLLLFFTNNALFIGAIRLTDIGLWLGLLFAFVVPLAELLQRNAAVVKNIGYSLCGLLYISLSLGLLVNLRMHWAADGASLGLTLPLLLIFTLWVNDTMAYIVGSFIGKTPLSSISPKKTWEGTIGGVLLAIVVMGALAYSTGRLSLLHTAIITALAAISGTFGDLFESKLKRLAGVKDSGTLLPGHGGFLDRFDSLLFASTVVWVYALLFL